METNQVKTVSRSRQIKISTDFKRHTSSSSNALALIKRISSTNQSEAIKENLNSLKRALMPLVEKTNNDKAIYKAPVLGKIFRKITEKSYEDKFKTAEGIVTTISNELTTRKNALIEDDLQLSVALKDVEKDIDSNKKELERYQTVLDSIPGDEESELKDTDKTIIVGRISGLQELLAEQNVQRASLAILKSQNILAIDEIGRSIDKAVISLTTSVFIDHHLQARRELTEAAQSCNEASAIILEEITQEIQSQTVEFQNRLVNGVTIDRRVDNAINKTIETCNIIANFNDNVLPDVLEKLKSTSEKINSIESTIDNSLSLIQNS